MIKSLYIVTILLLVSTGSYCQFHQSSDDDTKSEISEFFIGGSFNFYINSNTSNFGFVAPIFTSQGFLVNSNRFTNKSISFSPILGKQLNKSVSLGILMNISKTNTDTYLKRGEDPAFFDRYTGFNFGIFMRKIINPNNKLQAIISPTVAYQSLKREFTDGLDTSKSSVIGFAASLPIGALYQFNNSWRATIQIGGLAYRQGTNKSDNFEEDIDYQSFRFDLSVNTIYFGAEYLF